MLLEYEHIDSGFIIIRLTIVHNMCDTKKAKYNYSRLRLIESPRDQAILTRLIEKFDPIKTPILTKITKFKLKLPNI